jgi:predicted amidophosphoribosyltransferase
MPLFSYRLWRRELLFLWKGRGVRLFTPLFGGLIEKAWPEMCMDSKKCVLIPIPPRPGKIRDKGWDQVEDLYRYLEYRRCIPVARLLCRRSKKQQKKMLGLEGRMENARASYVLRPLARVPPHIVLLDDVRTTGATLEACAALLKAAGALSVQALTLFGVD